MTPEEIVKIIDSNNTFLNECQEVVEKRFGKEVLEEVQER